MSKVTFTEKESIELMNLGIKVAEFYILTFTEAIELANEGDKEKLLIVLDQLKKMGLFGVADRLKALAWEL